MLTKNFEQVIAFADSSMCFGVCTHCFEECIYCCAKVNDESSKVKNCNISDRADFLPPQKSSVADKLSDF